MKTGDSLGTVFRASLSLSSLQGSLSEHCQVDLFHETTQNWLSWQSTSFDMKCSSCTRTCRILGKQDLFMALTPDPTCPSKTHTLLSSLIPACSVGEEPCNTSSQSIFKIQPAAATSTPPTKSCKVRLTEAFSGASHVIWTPTHLGLGNFPPLPRLLQSGLRLPGRKPTSCPSLLGGQQPPVSPARTATLPTVQTPYQSKSRLTDHMVIWEAPGPDLEPGPPNALFVPVPHPMQHSLSRRFHPLLRVQCQVSDTQDSATFSNTSRSSPHTQSLEPPRAQHLLQSWHREGLDALPFPDKKELPHTDSLPTCLQWLALGQAEAGGWRLNLGVSRRR